MKSTFNKILFIMVFSTTLFSCTVYQERNDHGFGVGGLSSWKTSQSKQQKRTNTVQEHCANQNKINKDAPLYCESIDSIKPSEPRVNSHEKKISISLNKKLKPKRISSFSTKILLAKQLLSPKFSSQASKASLKQRLENLLPDSTSDFGYWFLFILCALILSTALIIFLIELINPANGKDAAWNIIGGLLLLIIGMFYLLGLISYDKLDECGSFYSFGFWSSMFCWYLGWPLLIWLIASLICQ